MPRKPDHLFVSAVKFLTASTKILELLSLVLRTWKMPPEWNGIRNHAAVMTDRSDYVYSFLVLHGKEKPENARQIIATVMNAFQKAREQFKMYGLENRDPGGLFLAAKDSVIPIMQAINLYQSVAAEAKAEKLRLARLRRAEAKRIANAHAIPVVVDAQPKSNALAPWSPPSWPPPWLRTNTNN